ncbi:MAG: SDR family NAD(P)-dependent oxidoreductase [Austwickia sp.]|jgi:short-subunit dehydrogenase|nr:MAG: SDR family NAD(P)-dependent oxidoreductase [Austwickia sp.]
MTTSLTGRMLVTGASAGIGAALARRLAPTASELVLVARRRDRLEALAGELRAGHPQLGVTVRPTDLADTSAVSALADEILAAGPIDVLINNAGLGQECRFVDQDWDRIAQLIAVNVTATTALVRRVGAAMAARGAGAIMVVGSGAGQMPMANGAVYAATKHYVHGLCESWRLELAGTGVTRQSWRPARSTPSSTRSPAWTRARPRARRSGCGSAPTTARRRPWRPCAATLR